MHNSLINLKISWAQFGVKDLDFGIGLVLLGSIYYNMYTKFLLFWWILRLDELGMLTSTHQTGLVYKFHFHGKHVSR